MRWESDLDRWLTTPPEESEPAIYDSLDNPIYEGDAFYSINGWILSEEGLEECGHYLDEEGETFICPCCEDEFYAEDYDELYYTINCENFCSECVMASKEYY